MLSLVLQIEGEGNEMVEQKLGGNAGKGGYNLLSRYTRKQDVIVLTFASRGTSILQRKTASQISSSLFVPSAYHLNMGYRPIHTARVFTGATEGISPPIRALIKSSER